MRALTRWNERFGAWVLRHPWGYSLFHATVLVGVLALLQRGNLLDLWHLLVGGWVVIFLVTGLTRKLLPSKKATPIGSSLPPGAGAMDEDGAASPAGVAVAAVEERQQSTTPGAEQGQGMSRTERVSGRSGTAPGRVFRAMPMLASRRAVTVTAVAALAAGLMLVLWRWLEAPGAVVPFAVVMLVLLAWGAARAPVDYRLVDGPVVVVHRRLFPDVPYRVTGGVEGFNDLEALHRRNQPSETLVAGGGAFVGGTHLTGEKGMGASYQVFQRYTVQENLVRVEVAGGTLLVSPADRQGFIDAVRASDPGHG